jgi:hypothetical protein
MPAHLVRNACRRSAGGSPLASRLGQCQPTAMGQLMETANAQDLPTRAPWKDCEARKTAAGGLVMTMLAVKLHGPRCQRSRLPRAEFEGGADRLGGAALPRDRHSSPVYGKVAAARATAAALVLPPADARRPRLPRFLAPLRGTAAPPLPNVSDVGSLTPRRTRLSATSRRRPRESVPAAAPSS